MVIWTELYCSISSAAPKFGMQAIGALQVFIIYSLKKPGPPSGVYTAISTDRIYAAFFPRNFISHVKLLMFLSLILEATLKNMRRVSNQK
jgi:hypothetical protein